MATPNMGMTLPVPTVTLGPQWANELNAALNVIDSHDHSSGLGAAIHPAGLDIDSDLDFQMSRAFNLKSTQYDDQAVTLTGAANVSSVYSKLGDLWWTNGAGIAVQLTSGSTIISTPSSVDSFEFDNINTSIAIGPSDTYVVLNVDCSALRTITLPAASAVTPGRLYLIKDATSSSESFNMTIAADGSDEIDGAATVVVNSNGGCVFVASNGVDGWSII